MPPRATYNHQHEPKRAYTAYRGSIRVSEIVIDEKRQREELKARRDALFEQYLKNPLKTRLALEIKTLDDQIAEHTKQIEQKTRSRT
jgi:hypothetical protein